MKKKTIQRAFAWALTLVMVLSAAPLGVFAEGEEGQTCICTVKCGETGNAECPVCNENAEKCAVTAQKQEEPETKETPTPPKAENQTPESKVEKKTEDTTGNTGNPPAAGGDEKTNPQKKETPSPVEGGQGGPTKTQPFTVTFNANGGDDAPAAMTTKEDGTLNGTLPEPTKTGHTFAGWFVDSECTGTAVDATHIYTADTALYAKWTENTPTGTGSDSSENKKDESLEFKKNDDINTSFTYGTITPGDAKVGHKITFDVQKHGNKPNDMITDENGKLSAELPTLTATGYTFGGWYLDDKCSEGKKVENDHPFDGNTTLYANWTPITYTVTFHDNYSTRTDTLTFEYNSPESSRQLGKRSREYYDFDGWAETPDGGARYFQTDIVENLIFEQGTTLDLYAVWIYKPRKVTFNACGGKITKDGKEVTSDEVKTQESPLNTVKAEDVHTPTQAGYAFLGWYDQKTNNKFSLDTPYNEDTILEARWVALETPNGVIPAGNFLEGKNLEDGTKKVAIRVVPVNGPDLEQIKNKLGVDGEKLAVYDLSVQMLNEDGTKLGEFESVNGLIQFNFTVTGNVEAVYHNGSPMSKDTKPGYSQNGNTLTIWANSFSPYAIVTDGYRITLDPQGGTLAADVPNTIVTKLDGTLKEPLPTPTKTGYTFGGWYLTADCTGNRVTDDAKFETNAKLYAKWTPITYTVVFHDNYRKPEKTSEQTFTYEEEKPLSYDDTKIKREYYQLDGWAETSDGEIVYGTNQQVKNLCSQQGAEKHLYAVWSYQRKTVIFDADGGKIKENGKEEQQVTVFTQESPINTVKAKEVPVPMTREGYYFGGWYTDKDGKGDLVKPDKTEFTDPRSTVYAYWIEFKPVTVTFKCQGGTARIGSADVKEFTMQTKWPGVLDGTPTTPSRSSYKFEGWYTAAGVKVDEDTLFLKDATVYARWKRAVSITGNPRTGDQVKLEAAIAILVAAAIGLGATVVLKKRKDK